MEVRRREPLGAAGDIRVAMMAAALVGLDDRLERGVPERLGGEPVDRRAEARDRRGGQDPARP
jgi:hypothetical protein